MAEAWGHHLYRAGHVDGVHCAGSVECDWRGETVEDWQAHRDAMAAATEGGEHRG